MAPEQIERERADFEEYMIAKYPRAGHAALIRVEPREFFMCAHYKNGSVQEAFEAWLARAKKSELDRIQSLTESQYKETGNPLIKEDQKK